MALLVATKGIQAGRRYEVPGGPCVLGRHPDCEIVVESGAVSRQHARIVQEGGQYLVEDLKSRNGTYVNEERIFDRRPLRDGDQLRVCDVVFAFHNHQPPVEAAEPGAIEDTSMQAVLVDDDTARTSTIMSKLDVSSNRGRTQLVASPEVKLSALLEITQSLGKALSLDEVLPKVLNSLFKIFVQADRGFIVLRGPGGQLIPRWTKLRRESSDQSLRISRTIVNGVMQSKEAILSADAASDARFEMSESIADFRIRSMICVPLIDSDGQAMGALQIDTLDQRTRFDERDLEVVASVATQAGIAIDNAQLHEQALRQRSLERELELAHEVQRGFLPDEPPRMAGYSFFHYYMPANHVGGDYYDYLPLPDGRTAILVADVVGHGVAAALLMAKLSAEARFCLASESQPAAAVTRLNQRLSNLQLDRFVTMVMGVLDPVTHQLTVVNAGHMPPLLRRAGGQLEEPGEAISGLPLGVLEDTRYDQHTLKLESGELVVLFTDGIHEAVNDQDQDYGLARLRQLVTATGGTPQQVGQAIVEDVRQFLGSTHQEDDMCLVCFDRNG